MHRPPRPVHQDRYRAGRRLYVGTTELEAKRPVIWDLGEIACRGTMDDLVLFRQVLLASAAIPGFFPPVRIPVTVDGQELTERHVDGGVTNALFFRPPYVGHRGWIGLRLDVPIDDEELRAVCEDAYRTVAPKKRLAELKARYFSQLVVPDFE